MGKNVDCINLFSTSAKNMKAVIDIQDLVVLVLWASYNSAGLAQKKKTLALIENKAACPGQSPNWN